MNTYSDAQGDKIAIIVPTLDYQLGWSTGTMARTTSGCASSVDLLVVHDKHNQGFTKTVNEGIRMARTDADVCLLNDDVTTFQYGWLEIMRRVLYAEERFGLVGPSGACGAAPMNQGLPGMVGFRIVPQISFWCVLLKRAMIDQLGVLDEVFIHYCSDNWYCHRMAKNGWQCVWAKSVYLEHTKHASGIKHDWKKHDRRIYFERLQKSK